MRLSSHLFIALLGAFVLSLVALVIASAANAKELKSAQVCGLDEECVPMGDRGAVESITNFSSPAPPPPTAAYYRLDFVYGAPGGRDRNAFSNLFVPSRNLIATGGPTADTIAWFPVTGAGLDLIRRSISRLQPFAAPDAWPSSIDDPLFRVTKPSTAADRGTNWTPWLLFGAAGLLLGAALGARRIRVRHALTAALVVAAFAALAAASVASAKNLTVAQACGPDDCAPLDKQHVMPLLGGSGSEPPPTAAYYRLDFTFSSPDGKVRRSHSHLYVPSRHLVAAGGEIGEVVWFPVTGAALEMLDNATSDLEPFAARAAWPTRIADPVFTPSSPAPAAESRSWPPWFVAAAVIVLALAAGAIARRFIALRLSQET
jgi:hypothetical protein